MQQMNQMMNRREGHCAGGAQCGDLRNAILLIDKPMGKTSYETVSEIQRLTGAARTGHAGTLDRFASGLLVACSGQATKLARYLLEDDKAYCGAVKLGVSTDTDDGEGAVIEERPVGGITREAVIACAEKYTGELMQLPPRYSALKINGRRASDRARDGENVELSPRRVAVYHFDVFDIDLENARFLFRLRCSKGTYVRSLARDMGRELGTGAYLESLRRTGAGIFSADDAATLEELSSYVNGCGLEKRFMIRPVDALRNYGMIVVKNGARERVLHGAGFLAGDALKTDDKGGKIFIILDESENLIAIADVDIQKWHIKYLNVFNS
jgi:tRNA pseudouridine55 synthase